MADLLEKHIGATPNAIHCKDAFDALLARDPEDSARKIAEAISVLQGDDYVLAIGNMIRVLRANKVNE